MSRNGYACEQGKWPKAQDIYNELHELTSKPIYCVSDAAYKDIVENYFDKQCAKSKAITTEAKQYIPGGVQHNLAFNKPFPMCMVKAEGAYLYDADGNKYFDFLQAGGPTILGSNFPEVQEQAIELIKSCGPVTGLFHEAELLLAKEINKHMPACEMFRMLGSGTESVMAAIRVSRCATKNKRVIKVGRSVVILACIGKVALLQFYYMLYERVVKIKPYLWIVCIEIRHLLWILFLLG